MRDLLRDFDNSASLGGLQSATDGSAGLVSLGFIGSALRRTVATWITVAVIGLFLGAGLAESSLSSYSGTTTVLVAVSSSAQGSELETDATIAQSTPVAAAAIAQLRIHDTPAHFLGTYKVVAGTTTNILTITATGPNSQAAVERTSAVAAQFLAFRTKYLQGQLQQTIDVLQQQVSQAQQSLNAIDQQIKQLSEQTSSSSQLAQLGNLHVKQTDAVNALTSAKQNAAYSQAQARTQTSQMENGSEVLSPAAPTARSAKKTLALYGGGGLVGGLMVGMMIVVIGAITSNRLRRRDDISIAVGTPVRLSVGRLRRRRLIPKLRKNSGRLDLDMERVVNHLRTVMPPNPRGAAGLTVVAVDDAPTVGRAVVRLANAFSQEHRNVVVADLSTGAQATRHLGIRAPGISTVSSQDCPITVVVPGPNEVAPIGPFRNSSTGSAPASEEVLQACAHADLVLSIATLSPAYDSDYLPTWATDAVVVVTAGQSTAERLHAVGEMLRLAGMRIRSVVVLGGDSSDESIGSVVARYQPSASLKA